MTTREEIVIPVNARGMVKETKFYVLDGDMRYNGAFVGFLRSVNGK